MAAPSAVALLIVRVWRQEGSSSPLRIEIRTTTDVSVGLQPARTVSSRANVMDAVITFLDDASLQS
jgi:hypothetical protein